MWLYKIFQVSPLMSESLNTILESHIGYNEMDIEGSKYTSNLQVLIKEQENILLKINKHIEEF